MKLSTNRILTTHVGSLPRPDDLVEMLGKEDRGEPFDQAALRARTATAVRQAVSDQMAAGIDVIGDGEMSKMSYHVYAKHRLAGLASPDYSRCSSDLSEASGIRRVDGSFRGGFSDCVGG